MGDKPPTAPATLRRARAIALKNGIRYAYTGNIHDQDGQSTYCHACGELLIGRDWYRLSEWNLTPEGACRCCGEKCAGLFENKPGTWGARRMPVMLLNNAVGSEIKN
jgi:pyruvate formate lyase activating enzyme